MSPDAMTGMEANLRFAGPETMETKIFGRLTAWQNWIFQRPNAVGERGALTLYGKPERPEFDWQRTLSLPGEPCRMSNRRSPNERIPNNVDLSDDKKLQRALEAWQPNFINWWKEMGPIGFQEDDVFLRTAISVEPEGWANFDYVKMPDYRWGIFLADAGPRPHDRLRRPLRRARVAAGAGRAPQHAPPPHRHAGRHRAGERRAAAPARPHRARALYDLRNLFQVNVEEGRHLWAMVYLLHAYFGRDGREEAEALLERRSGDADKPRILGAFNEPMHRLALVLHVHVLHRPRRQVSSSLALAESGVRSAVAHDALHAHRGGAPHVRRRDRRAPRRRSHARADEGAQDRSPRRRAEARRSSISRRCRST